MKKILFLLLSFIFLLLVQEYEVLSSKIVVQLNVDGPIGPAIEDYVHQGIEQATSEKAELIILKLNTPGGLDKTMREIISDILASPIPVVTYVAPEGSRAASAGTYILYASHIAAMTSATNLGAATPISIGDLGFGESKEETSSEMQLQKKMMSDSVAYIRELAHLRGRNADWAEKAVREAASLSSGQALQLRVIDILAHDVPDLLKQINGKTVTLLNQPKVLNTQDVKVEVLEPNWRIRFLQVITDPNIAYILLIIGIWGIFFEFVNPGMVLPGVAGTIALLLGLYAFQLLPIHYTGLALTIMGLIFMASELLVPTHGVLSIGGVIAFFFGSILLLNVKGYSTPWGLIIGMSAGSLTFFIILLGFALKARKKKIVSGHEALLGSIAIVQNDFTNEGWVKVGGELWKARSSLPLKKGQLVEITHYKGLELTVKPLNKRGT